MNEALFAQVKRKLNVTWSDPETDANINDIINSAEVAMRHKLGITSPYFDFSQPGMENNLFRAYCLYDFNHCLNEFDVNYANDIAQARDVHILKQYQEAEGTENAEV